MQVVPPTTVMSVLMEGLLDDIAAHAHVIRAGLANLSHPTPPLTTAPPWSDAWNATLAPPLPDTSVFFKSVVVLFGTALSILTAGGNLLVMLSFKIERQLQTISNYFLLSLAVADVTIGLISVPLMTLMTSYSYWPSSYVLCQFWLCVDYTMSNASVLNLLLISFDRYFSITRPLTYRPRRTTRKAMTMVAATYVISVLLWPPWIIAWPYIEGNFAVPDTNCMVQFFVTSPTATIGTALAAFYVPVMVMVFLYARVYVVTQTRHKELGRFTLGQRSTAKPEETSSSQRHSSRRTSDVTQFLSRQNSRLQLARRAISNAWQSGEESGTVRHRLRTMGTHISRCVSAHQRSPSRACDQHLHTPLLTNGQTPVAPVPPSTPRRRPRSRSFDRANVNLVQVVLPTTKLNGVANASKASNGCELYTVLIEIEGGGVLRRPSKAAVAIFSQVAPGQHAHHAPLRRTRSTEGLRTTISQKEQTPAVPPPPPARLSVARASSGRDRQLAKHTSSTMSMASAPIKPVSPRPPECEGLRVHVHSSATDKTRKKTQKDEHKAAKTLSAILFAFVLTWLPYNVIVCLFASGIAVPDWLWTSSYYLCYLNSTINPIL